MSQDQDRALLRTDLDCIIRDVLDSYTIAPQGPAKGNYLEITVLK